MPSQKILTFDFLIDKKHYGRATNESPQYCTVEAVVTLLSHKVFVMPTHIKFNMWQLNYIAWNPTLAGEIRSAAIDYYNTTREDSEPFWDAEKEMIQSENKKA